jgi:YhcN/YlaJ family sporulation lipoprotein
MHYLRYFFLAALFLLASCGTQPNVENETNHPNETKPIKVENSSPDEPDHKKGADIAQHLVEVTESMPDVKDATAVVLGPYSVVGIDVKDDLERSEVESVKYTVAQGLKDDRYGANAVVVADPDTVARLREMAEDIQAGRPVNGIMDELAAIVGRVLPEMPNDMIDNQDETPTNESNDQLNQKQENELNKEQNDQSNKTKNK